MNGESHLYLLIMVSIHPQYITDPSGGQLVVLPMSEFREIMNELDELEDIRLYDEAKAANEPSIPIDEAFEQIEAQRKSLKV